MFRKKVKSGNEKPTQSQSITGSQINNSQVQMVQAGGDAVVSQSGDLASAEQGLTGTEVAQLLGEFASAIKAVQLPAAQEQKALANLGSAVEEAKEAEPDKDMVAKNLKRVNEALSGVDKATDTGKKLWEKGAEVFGAITPWLGAAAKLIGVL